MITAATNLSGCAPRTQRIEVPTPDGSFESGFYIPLNDLVIATTGGAQLVANGNLAISWVGSTFEGSVDANDVPQTSRARIGLRGAVTLEFALDAGAEVSDSLRLALLPLGAFLIDPVLVSPFLQITLHVTARVDAANRISVVAPFHVGSGFRFDGSLRAGPTSSPRFAPEVGLPDAAGRVTAQLDIEAVVAFLMSIEGIPLGGPVLGPSFGVVVDVDTQSGVSVDGRAEVVGGWAFPDPLNAAIPAIPEDLATIIPASRVDIVDIPGPIDVGTNATRWSRLYSIDATKDEVGLLPQATGFTFAGSGPTAWLASLDGLGVPSRQIHTDRWSPAATVEATNGDILVAGNSGNDARVDRFTSGGEPIWTRTLSCTDSDKMTFVAMAPTGSGGAIVSGNVQRSGVLTPFLAAVGDAGEVDWAIEVDMGSGSSHPEIHALAADEAGGFVAVGEVEFTDLDDPVDPPISGNNALILKFTDQGDLRQGFALGRGGEIPVAEFALQVVVRPDGSYVIGGHLGVAPHVWVASLDADDTLSWSASYRPRPDTSVLGDRAELRGMAAVASDELLVCGDISDPDADAWLMRLDAVGMPQWVKCYSSVDRDDLLSGVVALDDGVAAIGNINVIPGVDADPWILRGNVDGMVRFTEASGMTVENTQVEWLRVKDHTIRSLEPVATPLVLTVDATRTLTSTTATGFGELITE